MTLTDQIKGFSCGAPSIISYSDSHKYMVGESYCSRFDPVALPCVVFKHVIKHGGR